MDNYTTILLIIIGFLVLYLIYTMNLKIEYKINSEIGNIISKNPSIIYSILFDLEKDKKNITDIIKQKYDINELINNVNLTEENINKYLTNVSVLHYTNKYGINLETMMGIDLCKDLVKHVKYCSDIEGDFVDVGVWHGGSSMLMQAYNKNNKKIFLLDLFDHMDQKSINNDDTMKDKISIDFLNLITDYYKEPTVITSIDTVKNNFTKHNIPLDNCIFLKGNLNDENFPYDRIDKISLLRIDCDFYSATKSVLKNLYSKMTKGGVIIFDDFNIPCLGERDAAIEFFKSQGKDVQFYSVGQSAYIYV